MHIRSPRTALAISAVLALTVSAMAPTAAFAKGPGAADCDGDCTAEQPQAQQQVRARDGSNDSQPKQVRARDGSAQQTETQANAGGGQQVQARAGNGKNANTNGKNANANRGTNGQNVQQKQGAGRGQDDDSPRGPGNCDDCDAEMGTLDADQIDDLVFMAKEEKLAEDVYTAFAEMYDLPIFGRIADSEVRHQDAVATVMERYGIENTVMALPAGQFGDEVFNGMYTDLVAKGSTSLADAIAVGVEIEELDIADLEDTMLRLNGEDTAPDVYLMYSHLLTGSGHHLAAFQSQL